MLQNVTSYIPGSNHTELKANQPKQYHSFYGVFLEEESEIKVADILCNC
jgi:hypothetical protein